MPNSKTKIGFKHQCPNDQNAPHPSPSPRRGEGGVRGTKTNLFRIWKIGIYL